MGVLGWCADWTVSIVNTCMNEADIGMEGIHGVWCEEGWTYHNGGITKVNKRRATILIP